MTNEKENSAASMVINHILHADVAVSLTSAVRVRVAGSSLPLRADALIDLKVRLLLVSKNVQRQMRKKIQLQLW
jgi:hypothetical protein